VRVVSRPMQHNPYAAPMSPLPTAAAVLDEDRVVTPEIMEAMAQTRPWVSFLGVLGMIVVVLMVASSLWSVVMMGSLDGFMLLSGTLSLAVAALYLFPCIALVRYGGAIKRMQYGAGLEALTDALRRQKSFWRYTGVLAIVVLALYGVMAAGMFMWMG
jgi:hypothetical protein